MATAKYQVPEGEENTVIAEVEQRQWVDGEKVSKPYIYKTDVRTWNTLFLKNRASQGLKINKVLNLPKSAEGIEADPNKGYSLTVSQKKAAAKAKK